MDGVILRGFCGWIQLQSRRSPDCTSEDEFCGRWRGEGNCSEEGGQLGPVRDDWLEVMVGSLVLYVTQTHSSSQSRNLQRKSPRNQIRRNNSVTMVRANSLEGTTPQQVKPVVGMSLKKCQNTARGGANGSMWNFVRN